MTQAITITDDEILILAEWFVSKQNVLSNRDLLADVLYTHYRNQTIRVNANDGENLSVSGFLDYLTQLCTILRIPPSNVVVETHDTNLKEPFVFKHLALGLFLGANKYIPEFARRLDNPKFVGLVVGRFSPIRMRIAYEIDQAFPNDNYTIFQGKIWLDGEPFKELYQKELDWFYAKNFEKDVTTASLVGSVGFDQAYQSYPNIWNHYQVEVVVETDPESDFWFTEKTARCLATGKPFVLINGKHSLKRLQEMGFETFGQVIDETYDDSELASQRISRVVNSLQMLYNDPSKHDKLSALYSIASRNQEHYLSLTKKYNVQPKI